MHTKIVKKELLADLANQNARTTSKAAKAATQNIVSKQAVARIPAKTNGLNTFSMQSSSSQEGEVVFWGYMTGEYMTHSDQKLEKQNKRCRKNLKPNQIKLTYSHPLGCANSFEVEGQAMSAGYGCMYDESTKSYNLIHGIWNDATCGNYGTTGPMTSEVLLATEKCGHQSFDDEAGNTDDVVHKYSFSTMKVGCGKRTITGIVYRQYMTHPNAQVACASNQEQAADNIINYPMGNCIESVSSESGAIDGDNKIAWNSYSFVNYTPDKFDTSSHGGLGNSNVTLAAFKNKGCREKNFLATFEIPANELFDFDFNACSPVPTEGGSYYARIGFQMP
jgi:hypothetical protein